MASFSVENLKVVNEAKAGVPIHTGVGFLDHMLDQLNSHAQVGVGLTVTVQESDANGNGNGNGNANKIQKTDASTDITKNRNRLASQSKSQTELFETVGTQVGKALKEMIGSAHPQSDESLTMSRFCCPLDEALVECILAPSDDKDEAGSGSLESYTLAPFGKYPKLTGRTHIGTLETAALQPFWQALAKESGLQISLNKLRGDNAHHIVESSFKAFSRALRNYLDASQKLWTSGSSDNDKASIALAREGKVVRQTKETSISVLLQLNGQSSDTKIDTGISIMDQFFTLLASEANMTLQIACKGDLWVDDHHTSEDVSIAVGQCLDQALGTKAGLNRMWLSRATLGQAQVEVTMDLSNRPCLRHNLDHTLEQAEYVDDSDTSITTRSKLSCEMLEHVLDSLVMNGRMTVHIVELAQGATVEETVLCTAMAFGKALRVCAMVDCRRAGQTASSKGTLSV